MRFSIKKYGFIIVILSLIGIRALPAAAQGTALTVSPEQPYYQELRLEPGSSYRVGLNLRSSVPNAIVYLTVELFDGRGEKLGLSQVQRGLGDPDRWYNIGIEVTVPENYKAARLSISVDQQGEYWWDALRITQLETSVSAIRKFWEERIQTYGTIYTGLVIDTRGLNVGRGMSPSVWSESGQLIYGGIAASYDFLQQTGIVSYGSELTPELYGRIAVDPDYPLAVPLIVKAVQVIEPTRTSVVISDEDAERVLKALAAYDFLARFAVVFLID